MVLKFGIVVAGIQQIIPFELILPFNDWFGIIFPQIINVVVYQLAMTSFVPTPTNQLGLFKVFYTS